MLLFKEKKKKKKTSLDRSWQGPSSDVRAQMGSTLFPADVVICRHLSQSHLSPQAVLRGKMSLGLRVEWLPSMWAGCAWAAAHRRKDGFVRHLLATKGRAGYSDYKSRNVSVPSPVQFSSVTQSCQTLCDPMDSRTPGLPVHHQLPEPTEAHVHWVGDAVQPSHPLSSP